MKNPNFLKPRWRVPIGFTLILAAACAAVPALLPGAETSPDPAPHQAKGVSPDRATARSGTQYAQTDTTQTQVKTNPPPAAAAADKPAASKPAKAKADKPKKLSGQELYAINCNRCHAERYPTEFTAAQWKTLMMHMRVRANLPAEQAKAILKYLQEDAGN
jgi:hypothetical protein